MIDELLKGSKEIIDKAVSYFKPKANVLMLSGGDDSLTAYHVARELGVKIDFVIHGNTRTGISETTDFVRQMVANSGYNYLEADAGNSYQNYVMRKGFFGKGNSAHDFSYHVLKIEHFRKTVSRNIRKRARNFPVLFINGARRKESENRMITMVNPYRKDPAQKNNIWVNIINEWDKPDCKNYLEGNGIKRCEVAVNLCRSGECMCGTMQSEGDRAEASFFYPKWGQWLNDLEKEVMKKFSWSWNDSINKYHLMEMKGQINMFQPMCTGCKINSEHLK